MNSTAKSVSSHSSVLASVDSLASVPGVRDPSLAMALAHSNELLPQGSPHSLNSTSASSFSSSGSLPLHQQHPSGESILGLIHRNHHNVDNALYSSMGSVGHSRTMSSNSQQSLVMNSRTPSESNTHSQPQYPYQQHSQTDSAMTSTTTLEGNPGLRANTTNLPESQGSTFLSSPNETTDDQGAPDSPVGAIPSNWSSPPMRIHMFPMVTPTSSGTSAGLSSPAKLPSPVHLSQVTPSPQQQPHLPQQTQQQQQQTQTKPKKEKHTFGGMSANFLTETLPATGMKLYPGSKRAAKSHGDMFSASSSNGHNSGSSKMKKSGSGSGSNPLSSINTKKQQLSPGGIGSASTDRTYSSSTSNMSTPLTGVVPHHHYLASPTFSRNNHSSLDAKVMAREMAQGHATEDVWQALCIKVLTLFNGQGLTGAIEDLNDLVRRCLLTRSAFQLCDEINELLKNGMLTLNAKLGDVPDEKLVSRLVEVWSFFFGTVLPYFEGVFLPLQVDLKYNHAKKITRKTPGGGSGNNGASSGVFVSTLNNASNGALGSLSTGGLESSVTITNGTVAASPKTMSLTDADRCYEDSEPESVRTMALTGFRDLVILPMIDRLEKVFAKLFIDFDASIPVADTASRMLQMTFVLTSIQSGDAQQLSMEKVSNRLKSNWKQFTRRGNRGGFIGLEKKYAPAQVPAPTPPGQPIQ
ncbi:hypothetical protein BGZ67_006592 [Mortierella alpina]|nr:hypothetical protein BGZ67_006592 [Mortierella alpina]